MNSRILAFHCGTPRDIEWDGKTVSSSIFHQAVPGPLHVSKLLIEGNAFASPNLHGQEHAVLYAFGKRSADGFARMIGLSEYEPGSLGENITLDVLDEEEVSAGDLFEFGEVLAEATYPRIPCGKVNFRMRNPGAQKALQDCGRSGVYFRIKREGRIQLQDPVRRVQSARIRLPISYLYRSHISGAQLPPGELRAALENGSLPLRVMEKFRAALAEA